MIKLPLILLLVISELICYKSALAQDTTKRYSYAKGLMGSEFNLIFYAKNDALAQRASDSVFLAIQQLNNIMSDYLDGSELNRLSASAGSGQWVSLSDRLFDILWQSQLISHQTQAAFDVTVGPAVQVWRRAMRRGYFPEKIELKRAKKAVGHRFLQLDSLRKSALLSRKNMRLDVGGIGKGYAADVGLQVLAHFDIQQALVDAGGDLAIGNAPPNQVGWRVEVSSGAGIDSLKQTLLLKNCGVATSGQSYRYLEHNGRRYSHIVNPRTGVGLLKHVRTTVIAPNGTTADALATAFSVLGVKKSAKVLKRHINNTQVWVIEQSGMAFKNF